jgi:nucleoside-diphosphate-sugar epimerase
MTLLILGAGYIGERVSALHPDSVRTHRTARDGSVRFDLADASTWALPPDVDRVLWTFPATPIDQLVAFWEQRLRNVRSLVVLGSTSAYLASEPDALVDETTQLDVSQSRVVGEEALRERSATILCLAGIWGPARDPIRWLLDGRIKNGRKYVNLAHVDDIVAAIDEVLASPRPGERINVCDGEPRRWSDHVERLKLAGRLKPEFTLAEELSAADSKRVANERLRALLPGRDFTRLT